MQLVQLNIKKKTANDSNKDDNKKTESKKGVRILNFFLRFR